MSPSSAPPTPAEAVARPAQTGASASPAATLRPFVEAYWLRPENAVWMALRSLALARRPLKAPSLDLGCGDGVFSFLHAGGRLDPSFDVFQHTTRLHQVRESNVDIFDGAVDGYAPTVVRGADWSIDLGADLKPALLAKALALDFYGRLIQLDADAELSLPEAGFASIYCNTLYWFQNVSDSLRQLRRAVREDGVFVAHVKLASMNDATLDRFRPVLGETFLSIIDRGRRACWPSLFSRAQWEQRFQAAGWRVKAVEPIATLTHAHIWDIGLRPIAPLLVRMANALNPQTRAAIKRDWVSLLMELLEPLTRPDLHLVGKAEPAELQYILRPA